MVLDARLKTNYYKLIPMNNKVFIYTLIHAPPVTIYMYMCTYIFKEYGEVFRHSVNRVSMTTHMLDVSL